MSEEYKSYMGYTITPDGTVFGKNKRTRKLSMGSDGYYHFSIYDKMHVYNITVHKIVAELYVPNPDPTRYKYVVHKDGNKLNNNYTNLEWTDRTNRLGNYKRTKRVCMCDKDGMVICEYLSISAAANDHKLLPVNISNYVHGKSKDKRGYVWKFKE